MFQRKALKRLKAWKQQADGREALLIEGARRVGKSTLAETFAKEEYRSYILIDFARLPKDVKAIFEEQQNDFDTLFMLLSAYYQVQLHERDSLIIFDEVQQFPHARGLIKYLVADGRYDYMETGSLVSIKKNVRDIVIPSEERKFELNPFDFEEFCWAMNEKALSDAIRLSYEQQKPLPDALHKRAIRLWREYMLVGGMPQAVSEYVESRNFAKVDYIKRGILDLYREDIGKFSGTEEARVRAIFDTIPSQLSKHEKKFTLASLHKDARSRTYENAFSWLSDARIVNICRNSTDPHVGLRLNEDNSSFKCYMADTGLLVSQTFMDRTETPDSVYRDILFDKLNLNEGMLVENAVAQQLRANGRTLFFFSQYDKRDTQNSMEIDFLITKEYPDAAMKPRISPIEVKSSNRYGTASLKKYRQKFGKRVGTEYVLHPRQMAFSENRVSLPLYMAWCL
ncbi:ATP-binding protein [Rubneribacter sp.]|nr:AAA family ATPase [Candidatus Rubneribacter avistercoris]